MQKLSLSVLLHFLRKYSHWNLVRQSQCYHLYFIAKEDKSHRIKPRKKRRKDVKSPVKTSVTCNKIRSSTKSSKKKDILIFNQISKDVQDRVSMGHEVGSNVTTLTSRRSSFSSFIWDDYLPSYKLESDDYQDDDRQSNATPTFENDDSGSSTPVRQQNLDRYCEDSVLRQGDRLLKEMLQLRRDLERDKTQYEIKSGKDESSVPGGSLLPNYGPLPQDEENVLREKLEKMTEQIKKEMEEEFKKQQNLLEFEDNEDDDSKIKKIFTNILLERSEKDDKKQDNKEALQDAVRNMLMMNETPKTFEEAHKMFQSSNATKEKKSMTPSKKLNKKPNERNNSSKKTQETEKNKEIEIPFCSHKIKLKQESDREKSSTPTPSSIASSSSSKAPPKSSSENKICLSEEEQRAANDILRNLIEIRGNRKQNTDPVLDTMISVIQLSSGNLSLPSPVTSGAASGIHFRELFNFEVNFSESKEAFAKLAGCGEDKNVSVQELFPWTLNHSKNKQYDALTKSTNS